VAKDATVSAMKQFFRYFLAFVALCVWLSLIISWSSFSDPDVFYHAKMAQLMMVHGPIQQFPWLDLTLLGPHFADLHFLFHVMLIPFVSAFGLFVGGHVAAVVLSAVFFLAFYESLKALQIRWPLGWTILLALTYPLLVRIMLGKATPIALLLFVVGIVLFWKRRPWFVGFVTMLFALSHGGWPYLAGSCVLLACAEVVYAHVVLSQTWKQAIVSAPWKEVVASFVGAILGLIVHPNFPNDLIFSWTQVVVIGLGTPFQHVQLGNEWLPADPGSLAASFAPWLTALLLGLLGLFLAAKRPIDHSQARIVTAVGWILAVLVALTLKSRRNVEYLAPLLALWCASLWSLIDLDRFWQEVKLHLKDVPCWARRLCAVLVVFLVGWSIVRGPVNAWQAFREPDVYTETSYRAALKSISDLAKPGDRVFHSSWDEFPMLFAADDRLRYVSGLDPTFLYVASSTLSDDVRDATWGATTSTPAIVWNAVQETGSKFIFITKPNHQMFYNVVASDTRYAVLYDATDTASFEVIGDEKK
jgi:hypothetical protein